MAAVTHDTADTLRTESSRVWRHAFGLQPEVGAEIERLGYGAIWPAGRLPPTCRWSRT